jgi:hypothetical protein
MRQVVHVFLEGLTGDQMMVQVSKEERKMAEEAIH